MAKTQGQRRSKLQERRIAKDMGGRRQSGSGSSWRAKGDVRKLGELRIEAKTTTRPFYVLKLDDLLKIRDEAIKGGLETPVMQLEASPSAAMTPLRLAVLDYKLFHEWHTACLQKPIHQQDIWTASRSFKLDFPAFIAFQFTAMACKATPAMRVTFSPEDGNWEFVIIEWGIFKELYEGNKT